METQGIEYGILNIVAHPHSEGTYKEILERVSGVEVNFWGDLNAALRPLREIEPGVYQSEIVVGTEIDLSEPLIVRGGDYAETSAEDADVYASERHLYNGRIFLYTFIESRHLLFFESLNEFGKRLSPTRAKRIFDGLFFEQNRSPENPLVEVTVVPEDDSLDRLLGLERLDRVEIHLQKPNPADVLDEEVEEILEELTSQGAKRQDISLVRAPGSDGVKLNAANYIRAKVAQINGYVEARGRTEDGQRFSGSTKQYPKIVRVVIDVATSVRATALGVAKRTRIGQQPADDD